MYFTVKFSCAETRAEEINELIQEMEIELNKWQQEILKYRQNCQYLNYYTSKQLLYLRNILNKSFWVSEVVALLQSVSSKLTKECVQIALKHAQSSVTQRKHTVVSKQCHKSPVLLLQQDQSSATALTSEKQQVLNILIDDDSFSKKLVLKAFEVTGSDDYITLQQWCIANEQTVDNFEDNRNELAENSHMTSEVTESHPQVQLLIEDGYSLVIAIQAVKEACEDYNKAQTVAQSLESHTYAPNSQASDDEDFLRLVILCIFLFL